MQIGAFLIAYHKCLKNRHKSKSVVMHQNPMNGLTSYTDRPSLLLNVRQQSMKGNGLSHRKRNSSFIAHSIVRHAVTPPHTNSFSLDNHMDNNQSTFINYNPQSLVSPLIVNTRVMPIFESKPPNLNEEVSSTHTSNNYDSATHYEQASGYSDKYDKVDYYSSVDG